MTNTIDVLPQVGQIYRNKEYTLRVEKWGANPGYGLTFVPPTGTIFVACETLRQIMGVLNSYGFKLVEQQTKS